jgi:ribA/ribD-fused uncharacterized protein
MWTRDRLIRHLDEGHSADFLFFWGHTQKTPDAVDKSCFSQWFPRAFVIDDVEYKSAEHWMMAEKARLFRDEEALAGVLSCTSPAEAKAWGRAVKSFDADAWSAACSEAVVRGNVAKFSAHDDLRASNPDARIPSRWRGKNLLGFALMEARSRIRG